MKKHTIIFLILGLSVQLILAQKITSNLTKVDFKVKNAGFWVAGNFQNTEATLILNRLKWEETKLNGSVDVVSIKTGISLRDKHLINDDFFEADKYPKISLELLSIEAPIEGVSNSQFRLTIKDIVRDLVIPLKVVETKTNMTLSGSFKINRLEFGLGKKSITLSNEVVINFLSFFNLE